MIPYDDHKKSYDCRYCNLIFGKPQYYRHMGSENHKKNVMKYNENKKYKSIFKYFEKHKDTKIVGDSKYYIIFD